MRKLLDDGLHRRALQGHPVGLGAGSGGVRSAGNGLVRGPAEALLRVEATRDDSHEGEVEREDDHDHAVARSADPAQRARHGTEAGLLGPEPHAHGEADAPQASWILLDREQRGVDGHGRHVDAPKILVERVEPGVAPSAVEAFVGQRGREGGFGVVLHGQEPGAPRGDRAGISLRTRDVVAFGGPWNIARHRTADDSHPSNCFASRLLQEGRRLSGLRAWMRTAPRKARRQRRGRGAFRHAL